MAITNAFLEGDPTNFGTLAGVLPSLCSARVTLLPITFTSAKSFPGQGGVAPPSSVTSKAVRTQPRLGKAPWSKIKNLPFPIHPNFTQKKGSKTAPCYATFGRAFLAKTAFCLRLGLTPRFPGVQPQPRHSLLTFGAVGKSFFAAHCAPANPRFCP